MCVQISSTGLEKENLDLYKKKEKKAVAPDLASKSLPISTSAVAIVPIIWSSSGSYLFCFPLILGVLYLIWALKSEARSLQEQEGVRD